MANDFRILLQGILDERATSRNIDSALRRLGKQATVKVGLEMQSNKATLDKTVESFKSNFSQLGVEIDDKAAIKAVNQIQKAYDTLRKESGQSIGTKSPELQTMADYYKEAEIEAKKLNKTQEDNNLKQQLNYYKKIKSEIKTIADLERQLDNLRSKQNTGKAPENSDVEAELNRQLKNAQSRKKYNESQLDKKDLRDNSLEREVNSLASSLSDRNAINRSQLSDNERLSLEKAMQRQQANAVIEAEKLNKIQEDNNLKQQLNYYKKIKSEIKTIADLERQLDNLRSKQNTGKAPENSDVEAELNRQLKNAQSRKKYNESQLDKKDLRDNSLEREVNSLASSLSERNAINRSQLLDNERLSLEKAMQRQQANAVIEAEKLNKIQEDNNLKQQLNYYKKIKSEIKTIADLERQLDNLRSKQNTGKAPENSDVEAELNRQLKNAQSRKKYNESQLDKKDLRDNSLEREVNSLASSLSDRNAINRSQLLDNERLSLEKAMQRQQANAVSVLDRQVFTNRIEKWLKDNTKAGAAFQNTLARIKEEAMSCDSVRFSELKKEFRNTTLEAEKMGQTGRNLFDELRNNAQKFTQWFGVSQVVMQITQEIEEAVLELKEVDSVLTEISKTSNMTSNELKQLGDNSFGAASVYGRKATDYLLGVQEMSRAGYQEPQEMAELSIMAQSAGDLSAELANDYLIASDAAFDYSGNVEKLNALLDGQNQITNRNAVSMEELTNATKVAGGFLANVANLSEAESTALLGTGIATSRESGETVARAVRSIIMNLQGVAGEGGFDGEVIDEEQLGKVEARCHSLGVELEYMRNGMAALRDPIDVLRDLSEVYNSLPEDSAERAGLISDIGGKYRANVLANILGNFDQFDKMMADYENSSGSAYEEAMKSANNWEGSLNSLSNSWTALVGTFVEAEGVITATKAVTGLVDALTWLIDLMGNSAFIGTIAGVAIGIKGFSAFTAASSAVEGLRKTISSAIPVLSEFRAMFANAKSDFQNSDGAKDKAKSIFSSIFNPKAGFDNPFSITTNELLSINDKDIEAIKGYNSELDKAIGTETAFNNTMKEASPAAQKLVKSMNGAKVSVKQLSTAQEAAKASTIGLTIAHTALNAVIGFGIGLAIQLVVLGISKLINYEKELTENAETATSNLQSLNDEIREQNSTMNSISGEYAELSKGVNSLGENVSLTTDEYSRYHEITNQIADLFPTLVQGYDSEGNAILRVKGNIEELNAAYREAQRVNASKYIKENGEDIEDSWKLVNESRVLGPEPGQVSYSKLHMLNKYSDLIAASNDIDSFKEVLGSFEINELLGVGLERFKLFKGYVPVEVTKENFAEIVKQIKAEYDKAKAEIDGYINMQRELGQSYLFANEDYYKHLDSTSQNYASTLLNSIDADTINAWGGDISRYVSNLVSQLKDNDEFRNALGEMFALKDVDIPVNEIKDKVDEYSSIIADVLNIDKEVLKSSLGFDVYDDLKGSYDRTVDYINDNFNIDISSFMDENSINTEEEVDMFLELAKSCFEAGDSIDVLKNKYIEWKQTASSSAQSDIWDETYAKSFNNSLDNIQSAYSTLTAAANEYNQYGAYSLDTLQSLLALEPQYLAALVNENGQMVVNSQTIQALIQAQLDEAKSKIYQMGINELNALSEQASGQAAIDSANNRISAIGGINAEAAAIKANTKEELFNAAVKNAYQSGVSQEQIAAVQSKVSNMVGALQSTVNGISFNGSQPGGAGGSQDNFNDKIDETNEKLAELDEKEHLQNLQAQIERNTLAIEEFDSKLDLLDLKLDILDEDDYATRADVIAQKLELLTQKGSALKTEFEQLSNTSPQTADEAEEIASRMESIGDSLRSNLKDWVSYTKELEEVRVDAIISDAMGNVEFPDIGSLRDSFESEISAIDHNIRAIKGETLFGDVQLFSNIMPSAPRKSEVEKQADEEKELYEERLSELEAYEERVFEIKQNAQLLQEQANQEAIERERQELLDGLEEAKQGLQSGLGGIASTVANTVGGTKNAIVGANMETINSFNQVGQSIQSATDKILTFNEAVRQAQTPKFNTVTSNDLFPVNNIAAFGQKADGGVVGNGEITLVNERGLESAVLPNGKFMLLGNGNPQLINLPAGTKVIPAKETAELLKYTGKGINNTVIPHLAEGNVGDVSFNIESSNNSKIDNNVYLQLKLQELEYLRQLSNLLAYINSFADSSINTMPISHGDSGEDIAQLDSTLSSSSINSSSSKIKEFINKTTEAIENGLNSENISLEGLKGQIISSLTDSEFANDMTQAANEQTSNVIDEVNDNLSNSNNNINLLETLFEDNQDTDKLINSVLRDWEDLPKEMQDKLSETGINFDEWNKLIADPNNALEALQLLQDGSAMSWDSLSPMVQTMLLNMGIESKEQWDNYVESYPLQAFNLYIETWETTKNNIQQYMTNMVNIVITGATTIAATQIPAPQISNESWSNLQNLIAQRISGILNTINATFNENAVDLNFNVNFEMGTSQNNLVSGPQGVTVDGDANSVVKTVQQYLGVPYVWGGTSPSGFDCSGLMQYVFAQNGISISRTSQEQYKNDGTSVSANNLQPGDMLFFATDGTGQASHVGMYVGNNQMIHAPHSGDVVKYSDITSDYYRSHFLGAKRVIKSYAKGTSHHSGGTAIVGDGNAIRGIAGAAPEFIFHTNGTVELSGINGAEIRELEPGAVVLDAYKTKQLLKSSDKENDLFDDVSSYARGTANASQMARNMFTSRASKKDNTDTTQTSNNANNSTNATQGTKIDVPDGQGLGMYTTYMEWYMVSNKSSKQYKLRTDSGEHYNSEGFAVINGRNVLAMTSTFGGIGDYVDVYLTDGNVIHGIIGDEKHQGAPVWYDKNPANKWGHQNGKVIVEFVVQKGWNKGNPSLHGAGVDYVVNLGNYWGDPTFSGGANGGYLSDSMVKYTKAFNAVIEALKAHLGVTSTNTHTPKRGVVSMFANGGITGNNLSLVGEERPELAYFPNGNIGLIDEPTLAKFPKGTEIINGDDTADILKYVDPKRQKVQKFASGTVNFDDPSDRVIQAIIAQVLKDGLPDDWSKSENTDLKAAKEAYDWAKKEFGKVQSKDEFKEYKDFKIDKWFDSNNQLTDEYQEETAEYLSKITNDEEAKQRFDKFLNEVTWYNSEVLKATQKAKDVLTESSDNIVDFLEETGITMTEFVDKMREQAALSDAESFKVYSDYMRGYNERNDILTELISGFMETPEAALGAKQQHQSQMNEGANAIRADARFNSLLQQLNFTVEETENWYNNTGEFSEKYLSDLEQARELLSDDDLLGFQYYTESLSWYKKEWYKTADEIQSVQELILNPDLYVEKQKTLFEDIVKTANQTYKDDILGLYDAEKSRILDEATVAKEVFSQVQDAWNVAYDLYQNSLTDGSSYETQQKYYENLLDCNDALSDAQDWMNSIDDSWQDMIDGVISFYEELAEYTNKKYMVELSINERELEYLDRNYSHQQRLATQNIVLRTRQNTLLGRNEYIDKTKDELHIQANELRSQHQDLIDFMSVRGVNLENLWDAEGNLTNLYDDLGKLLSSDYPEMWAEVQQFAQSMTPFKEEWMALDEEAISNQEELWSNQQDIWRNGLDIALQIAENILNVHDNIISSLQIENDLLNRQMSRTSKYTEQQGIYADIISNDRNQLQALVNKRAEIDRELLGLQNNSQYSYLFNEFDVSRWVDATGEQTGYYLTDLNDMNAIGATEKYNDAVGLFELLSVWRSAGYEVETAIEDVTDQIKSDVDAMYQAQVDAANTAVESVISMIEARKERELKALDQVHDKRVEQLQEEVELVQDIYDKATSLLDDVKAEEDYERQLADEQKIADNLQAQIDQYALDDSDASIQRRIELQKQLNEQLEKIEDLKRNHEYEQTKKALSEDLELYNDYMSELQEAEDEQYQYNQQLVEGKYTQEKMYTEAYKVLYSGMFDDFTAKGIYSYEQLYNKGNQVATSLTIAYQNFATETGERFSELGVEFENMLGLFEKHSEIYDILTSDTIDWNTEVNAPYADSSGADYYGETPSVTTDDKGSNALTDSIGNSADIAAIINQMRTNSTEWFTATPERQAYLHSKNLQLAASIGAVLGDDGYYYRYGKRLYHTGKISDESKRAYDLIDKTLKPNEEMAIILESENVITTEKMQEWARGISLFSEPYKHSIPLSVASGLNRLDKTLSTATTNYNNINDNSTNVENITIGAGNNITKSEVRDSLKDLAVAFKTYR